MADFDDWGTEDNGYGADAGGGDGGDRPIQGGLLDPRTFPTPWAPLASDPTVEPQTPEITGPLDTDVHAQVLNDIRAARAKLPPLRHIDPYPAMNYLPPSRRTAPTSQSLGDFLDGVPLPKDAFGPHITFENDARGGPSTDRPVSSALASMVEHAVADSGFNSVNINSSVRSGDRRHSNHPPGEAVDINNIDGFRVIRRPDLATRLQDTFARQPAIRENFGPGYQVKTLVPGQPPTTWPNVGEDHQNHDHFSAR